MRRSEAVLIGVYRQRIIALDGLSARGYDH